MSETRVISNAQLWGEDLPIYQATIECPTCEGEGYVEVGGGWRPQRWQCRTCNGDGFIVEECSLAPSVKP